jgi:hypothetical protein
MKLENDTQVIGGINTEYGRAHYDALIASGMAWEFHPWLTGCWMEDKARFINEIYNTYANTED